MIRIPGSINSDARNIKKCKEYAVCLRFIGAVGRAGARDAAATPVVQAELTVARAFTGGATPTSTCCTCFFLP